ncbi:MAG: Leucine dehydrogenase [Chlamydiia bacterium]|nr:Leucine dehydrogenase [Chlamydiia bacterium]
MDPVLEDIEIRGFERVVRITHVPSGLEAMIAIHSTRLGPSLGGIRFFQYGSRKEALEDVLRLAKGMTYKSALAELGFGGGKAVVIADPNGPRKTKALLRALGQAVDQLDGAYICAEDSGCTTDDVKVINEVTPYVVGLPDGSGDPAIFTALGTFRGIEAVASKIFPDGSLKGKRVAVQGVGAVGALVAKHLHWHGAELIVSDTVASRAEHVALQYGAQVVAPDRILTVECDILSPCALGGAIHRGNVDFLQCRGIAGSANNQLATPDIGRRLVERGIVYAPDYVINSGGLINVRTELSPEGYQPKLALSQTNGIYDLALSVLEMAEKNGVCPHEAADQLALHKLKYQVGARTEALCFQRDLALNR